MKKLFLTAVAALALSSCTKEKESILYMPFMESEKSDWGLIGSDGSVLFNDEFKQMPTVAMNDRFFVKNKKGLWELYTAGERPKQIGDEYSQVGVFIEDVAPIVEKDKQIEFIDKNGDVKFTLDEVDGKEVTSCTNFRNGVAIFKVEQLYGCINPLGQVIVDPDYIMIFPASEGKMLALDKKQIKYLRRGDFDDLVYTVLSTSGEEIGSIKAKRFRITDGVFKNGALIVTDDSRNGERRVGLVDEKGDWILKPTEKIQGIKDVAYNTFIYTDGEQLGVMDFEGNVIIRPRYVDLVYAGPDKFFAKADKDNADYQLMDTEERQIGKDDYLNVLPLYNGFAFAQETDDNWIFINDNGEDQKLKQDIYCLSDAAMGDRELQNEHFDFNNIVSSLNITKYGMLGMNLNMDAKTIAIALERLSLGEDEDEETAEVYPKYFVTKSIASTATAKNNITMNVSATFDETIATMTIDNSFVFKTIKPNQIGLDIPTTAVMSGKSKQLFNAIINKIKGFGQVVKENQNAVIVNVGPASYFVSNSGSHIYVVYGLLDIKKIDLNQYTDVKESVAEPIRSAAEEFGKTFQEVLIGLQSISDSVVMDDIMY